ncbi:MAG: pyridoxamine 5'-phosphate oxidase family protein [Actinomycetota bacterium]
MDALTPQLIDFIEAQPMFFVATAAESGRVNVSPKGLDTLRVDGPQQVRWLNLTGSGNETAAHVAATGRMTLMFCSFDAMPMILRLYGTARTVHPRDADWGDAIDGMPELAGSRQVFVLEIESVATSCGGGVPVMTMDAVRGDEELLPFYETLGEEGMQGYWRDKNTLSIDGLPTGIVAR